MKKRALVGVVAAGVFLLGIIGSSNRPQSTNLGTTGAKQVAETAQETKTKPTCDGLTITTHCTVDGINYATYIYHSAVPEKSHVESVTTYQQKVTGYCTLCVDGTYSPSCATGRGACSYHGGVAQWNAPRYSNVPEYSTRTVIDAPAQEAYYEKVAE